MQFSWLTTFAVLATAATTVLGETHTITMINRCNRGTPTLIREGGVVVSTGDPYTANEAIATTIAYLQTGECGFNGENCMTTEITLKNPDPNAPGSGSSVNLSLIPPLAFNVPISFRYTGPCSDGNACLDANCPSDNAFRVPEDTHSQRACQNNDDYKNSMFLAQRPHRNMTSQTSDHRKIVALITGATGYIGGSVLSALLDLREKEGIHHLEFRAIVRDLAKAKRLQDEFGVETIVGTQSDEELTLREAEKADVLLCIGPGNEVGATESLLKGLKKRFEATGETPVLIHTVIINSGTGLLANSQEPDTETIWDDGNIEQMRNLPSDNLPSSRATELLCIDADRQGYVKSYIIAPSLVYGAPSTPRNILGGARISNLRAPFYQYLVQASTAKGSGISLGTQETIWPNVHLDDLTDLYLLLFKKVALESLDVPHGLEGHFLVGGDEHKHYDFFKGVAEALCTLGKLPSAEVVQLKKEGAVEVFGPFGVILHDMLSYNVRVKSTRAKSLGWEPKMKTADLLRSVREEVEFVAKS
ncbi:hypothetical protein PQX77_019904 [Marasmius sp. AFHP31]|nr:hypothetical protein PQX77_019904 [Marasmius sp. AFHP31]